jgi:type I restriction enzyme R subunit
VNDLFEGDLPDDDKLVYVSNVIAGKRLESGIWAQGHPPRAGAAV